MQRLTAPLSLSAFLLTLVVSLPACNESTAENNKLPLVATTATAESTPTNTATTQSTDPFALPDGGADVLLEFIEKLRSHRPTTMEEAELYTNKAPGAISTAAKRIMAMVPDKSSEIHVQAACADVDIRIGDTSSLTADERLATADDVISLIRTATKTSVQSASFHIERLMYLVMELRSAGELELAASSLREAADILVSTGDAQLADVAEQLQSQAKMVVFPILSEDKQRAIFEETRKSIADIAPDKLGETEFNTMRILIQELEDSTNKELTREAFGAFADILRKTGNTELSADVAYFETMSQPMDLEGKTFQGKSFDWESYRGKVVLVNFWATWCTPCLEKIPKLRKIQEKYGDRGFDVVAISLDENKAALSEFMATRGMPWTVLHYPGEPPPAAMRYHIESIPYSLLVDEQGYVVARNPSMSDLTEKLDELLEDSDGHSKDVAAQ